MTPITKNVRVVDTKGNEYGATYQKRAKGLVKNGRARFIDDNTICLACPPKYILEDTKVDNLDYINDFEANTTAMEHADIKNNATLETEPNPTLNMEYVLSRIDKIINDTEYIREAIETVRNLDAKTQLGESERGQAIRYIVQSRETTNQRLITLLEKMYDNLNPNRFNIGDDIDTVKFKRLIESLTDISPDEKANIIKVAAQQMFVKAGAAIVPDLSNMKYTRG